MKPIFFIPLLALLLLGPVPPAAKGQLPEAITGGARIGMPYDSLKARFPELPDQAQSQVQRTATMYDLEGRWTYLFIDEELKGFWFQVTEEAEEKQFYHMLEEAKHLETVMGEQVGGPSRRQLGDLAFRHPEHTQHEGYRVLETEWETETAKVRLKYHFLNFPEKKVSQLRLKLDIFAPDYRHF